MTFFIGLYVIILVILALPPIITCNKKKYYPGTLISLLILVIIYGFRNATGVDDLNYEKLFTIANSSTSWIVNYYGIEQSYIFISRILAFLGFNHQMVFFLFALFSFLFIYLSLRQLCENKVEYMLAITSFMSFCFIGTITVMRQFLSCAMVLYSMVLLLNNKNIKSIVMILLASFIHEGAVMCLLLHIFIIRPKIISKITKLTLPLLALFIGMSNLLNDAVCSVVSIFFNKYVYIITSDDFGIVQRTGTLIFIFLLLYYAQFVFRTIIKPERLIQQSQSTDLIERGELMFISIFFATISMGWVNRSYMYYLMFSMFFFITIYRSFASKNDKALVTTVALVFNSLYYGYEFYQEQLVENSIIPYSMNFNIFIQN